MDYLVRKLLKGICGRLLCAERTAVLLTRFLLDCATDKRSNVQTIKLQRIDDAVLFPLACQLATSESVASSIRVLASSPGSHAQYCSPVVMSP